MDTRTQRGFTLWELMVAVAVAGVVLGFGVPSFQEFIRNNAMSSAANDFVAGALMARAEAVKRHVPVTLCASIDPNATSPQCDATGSNGGFIVFVDENDNGVLTDATDGNAKIESGETVLLRREAPGGTIDVWIEGGAYISYGSNGFRRQATGQAKNSASRLLYCDDRGNVDRGALSTARVIRVDWTGRTQVLTSPDDVSSAASAISGADCS